MLKVCAPLSLSLSLSSELEIFGHILDSSLFPGNITSRASGPLLWPSGLTFLLVPLFLIFLLFAQLRGMQYDFLDQLRKRMTHFMDLGFATVKLAITYCNPNSPKRHLVSLVTLSHSVYSPATTKSTHGVP